MTAALVSLVNMTDGSVQVHKAGCKDLSRKARGKVQFADSPWELKIDDRREASEAYNADFDEETDGWHELTWMPCADFVPERDDAPAAPAAGETTMKVCGKWTRFILDGVEVGRIRNDQVAAAAKLLG